MGLRLYLYMGELWDTQRREWEDRKSPVAEQRLLPVIPVVYYTGEKRWSRPISLKGLMDLPVGLERFVPEWETLFLSLHETPPEALTRFASAIGWALRVLQAEHTPVAELERVLREAMAGIEGLTEKQSGQWLRVASFLLMLVLQRREETALADLVLARAQQSKFHEREEVTTMGMSVLQQIEMKGKAQAMREALETVLQERFGAVPESARSAIATAELDTLKAWLSLAIRAGSLAEVGIAPTEPGE